MEASGLLRVPLAIQLATILLVSSLLIALLHDLY